MSHSHKNGHGRCGVCGDAGEARREREADAARADEREQMMINQCMGCQAKWPWWDEREVDHRAPDGGIVTCTKERYE